MGLLSDGDIEARLLAAPDWRREGETIFREIELATFTDAMAYANRVAALAQDANHHPDLLVHGWNRVRLTLTSHSAGGLTAADFDLAARIDSEA